MLCIPSFHLIPTVGYWNAFDVLPNNFYCVGILYRMQRCAKPMAPLPRKDFEEIIRGLREARERLDQIAR